ncbi:DNA mismatch repair endonuclease MutL [Paucilactobacillus wasatchensis]|uniref:DNA mismatch repair protein MutL n=1 Tax=Paucilactobacillus wasatchensis TaxID=1335616 RepID=A0A0D1A5N0_9LACO|nr:DNA mismatch repair endonuclease MutL [Paucilactobacillus wasatchensis]KIS03195.1 DNA mismatch repair protein MutL [Paucilactobacillus wasatchensis]
MSKIHELNEVLADQIAAGEVIERPASIVKELVENSLDANSKQIDIIVSQSGLDSIRIIDDGAGILPDDVPIAFKRHATSKIASREDLFKVKSLGFRGEALPSIASVADVVLCTSTGDETGTKFQIRGGVVQSNQPAQARRGTDITVTDLFFNTPARLKYLKSPQTELTQITDIVDRLALANPSVAISFMHNDHEILRTPGNGNLQQVIAAIYGISNARKMVKFDGEDADFMISGYTSLPEATRSSRQYISIMINHRYIRNFQLTKALIQGYGSKLMVGRYPISVLDIELDPVLVDVNVHPAKREVRISKEEQLGQLIATTIRQRIAQENLIPDALDQFGNESIDYGQLQRNLNEVSQQYPVTENSNEKNNERKNKSEIKPVMAITPIVIEKQSELVTPQMQSFDQKYQQEQAASPFGEKNSDDASLVTKPSSVELELGESDKSQERFPTLQYLGQFHGTFLLAQAEDGLYILDQHAAQERINYEYYRQAIGEVSTDQQNLLVPLVLDYPTTDAMKINEHLDVLQQVGINPEPFGQNSFIFRSHPTWFKEGQEESTIREMIDWTINDGQLSIAQFLEKTAIMMSCKRAIKANHYLNAQQADALLKKLPECENPFNCPHGRPVLVHFADTDLEKMFKRIQDSHSAFAGEFDDHEF